MSARQAIADAVDAIEGLTCTPYFTQQIGPGVAFVKEEGTRYPNKFGGVVTWSVILGMPTDLATAEEYLERIVPQVVTALLPELQVTESSGVQYLDIPNLGLTLTAAVSGLRETEQTP